MIQNIFQRFLNDHSAKFMLISKKIINLQNLLVQESSFLMNGLFSQSHSFFIALRNLSNNQIKQYDLHNDRIKNQEEPYNEYCNKFNT